MVFLTLNISFSFFFASVDNAGMNVFLPIFFGLFICNKPLDIEFEALIAINISNILIL